METPWTRSSIDKGRRATDAASYRRVDSPNKCHLALAESHPQIAISCAKTTRQKKAGVSAEEAATQWRQEPRPLSHTCWFADRLQTPVFHLPYRSSDREGGFRQVRDLRSGSTGSVSGAAASLVRRQARVVPKCISLVASLDSSRIAGLAPTHRLARFATIVRRHGSALDPCNFLVASSAELLPRFRHQELLSPHSTVLALYHACI